MWSPDRRAIQVYAVTTRERPIGVKIRHTMRLNAPSPFPLPPGERVFATPSLDGRGKGEGDK